MFSLLVALLCIFLCQRRGPIWTAKALQRPAGHLSSPWRAECSASAECQWFVMTWEPADRQFFWYRKKGFLFVTLRKHQCPCNGLQLSEEASTWQLCGRTNLQPRWLAFPEFTFGYGVTYKQVTICCWVLGARGKGRSDQANWRHIVISY